MLGITHRGVKMPNIQLKSLVLKLFYAVFKIQGGSIDPLDPPPGPAEWGGLPGLVPVVFETIFISFQGKKKF